MDDALIYNVIYWFTHLQTNHKNKCEKWKKTSEESKKKEHQRQYKEEGGYQNVIL